MTFEGSRRRSRYPKGWGRFLKHMRRGAEASDLGFQGTRGDVIRFGNRYRLASSFDTLQLHGYSQSTVAGYSALFRVFLCWSCFEQFSAITGTNRSHFQEIFRPYGADDVAVRLKRIDRNGSFYRFLYERVNPRHRDELDRYLAGGSTNVAYLASSIRHIFAHGMLTPHANDSNPRNVVRCCDLLSDLLLTGMSEEFDRRVQDV
ncbi:hypothetical protein [Deferrisoma palaeochoriense]